MTKVTIGLGKFYPCRMFHFWALASVYLRVMADLQIRVSFSFRESEIRTRPELIRRLGQTTYMDSTFPFLLSILFSIPRFHIVFGDSIPRFHTVFGERGLEPKLLFNSSPSSKIPALFHFPFGCAYFPAAIYVLSSAYESFCLRLFSSSLCLFIWTSQKTSSTTGAKKRGCRNASSGERAFR